jgi:hypothetical protein
MNEKSEIQVNMGRQEEGRGIALLVLAGEARCADHVVAILRGNVLVVPLTRRRNATGKGAPS